MTRRRVALLAAGLTLVGAVVGAMAGTPGGPSVAAAQERADLPPEGATVRVVTKPLEPFVVLTDRGPEGFSVDLWEDIADRNGWETEWIVVDTVGELLDTVEAGEADAGIAGISVTREREERVDFSHAMFEGGVQILAGDSGTGVWSQLRSVLSTSLLLFVLTVVGVIVATGHLVWLVRRHQGEAPDGYLRGVGEGMWVSAATALAGDLGEGAPRRPLGRFVAILWILAGVVVIAIFTALLATRLTVDSIESSIDDLGDLGGRDVLTVAGSTSDEYLGRVGIPHRTVAAIEDAYPELLAGDADALVYDSPVLRYYAATAGRGRVTLVGPILAPESYGIAFPTGSALREPVNRALLDQQADGTDERLTRLWFGDGS